MPTTFRPACRPPKSRARCRASRWRARWPPSRRTSSWTRSRRPAAIAPRPRACSTPRSASSATRSRPTGSTARASRAADRGVQRSLPRQSSRLGSCRLLRDDDALALLHPEQELEVDVDLDGCLFPTVRGPRGIPLAFTRDLLLPESRGEPPLRDRALHRGPERHVACIARQRPLGDVALAGDISVGSDVDTYGNGAFSTARRQGVRRILGWFVVAARVGRGDRLRGLYGSRATASRRGN